MSTIHTCSQTLWVNPIEIEINLMAFGSATTFLAIAYITKSAAHSLTKYIPREECTNTFFSINSALSSHTWTQKLEHYGYFGMLWIFFALSFWRTLKRKYSYGTFHRNFQHTNIYKLNTVVVLNGTRHSAHFFYSVYCGRRHL